MMTAWTEQNEMTVGQCRKYISEGRVLGIVACGLTKRRTCHTICWLWLRVFGPEGSSDEVSVASHPVYRRRVRVFARANEDCIRCACSGGSGRVQLRPGAQIRSQEERCSRYSRSDWRGPENRKTYHPRYWRRLVFLVPCPGQVFRPASRNCRTPRQELHHRKRVLQLRTRTKKLYRSIPRLK